MCPCNTAPVTSEHLQCCPLQITLWKTLQDLPLTDEEAVWGPGSSKKDGSVTHFCERSWCFCETVVTEEGVLTDVGRLYTTALNLASVESPW